MTVTNVEKDPEHLTLTITAEYPAPIARAWQLWEDPRQLERWWGPPTYPATVVEHDLTEGGTITYFMTGPAGDRSHGWWRVRGVDPPHHLEFENGFADPSGAPDPAMPTMVIRVTLHEVLDHGTRMVVETTYPSSEVMAEMLRMGMDEGMSAAIGQIDRLLPS